MSDVGIASSRKIEKNYVGQIGSTTRIRCFFRITCGAVLALAMLLSFLGATTEKAFAEDWIEIHICDNGTGKTAVVKSKGSTTDISSYGRVIASKVDEDGKLSNANVRIQDFVDERASIDEIVIVDKVSPANLGGFFYGADRVKTIQGLENLDYTNNITPSQITCPPVDFTEMFMGCSSLTNLDLSTFDPMKISVANAMFAYCRSLKSVDLSALDTSKLSQHADMFLECSALERIVVGPKWRLTFNEVGMPAGKTWYSQTGAVLDPDSIPSAGVYTTTKPTPSTILTTGISLNASAVSLTSKAATYQLKATVKPANATNKTVAWSSSNSGVASVSQNGLVKAVSNGTATITARTVNGKAATAKITVNIDAQPTSVKINQGAFTLTKKSTSKQLSATVLPSNASNKTVAWSSSNTKVAKVSSSGKVTPVANGAAYITAKTSNGKTAKVKVTVKIVYPTKISITTKSFTLTKKDATKTVKYSLSGKGITDKTVKWSSSNKKVAKVSSSGKVTAVGNGSATITAKTANGKAAKVKVTAKIPPKTVAVSSVSLNSGNFTLTKKGATKVLKVTIKPSNATKKTVAWSSSNKKVATVSSSGKVTAVGNGSATITAKTSNGKYAQVKVTVKTAAASSKPTANQTARDIFNQYNAYRKSKGLKQVAWDDKLAAEALKSAKECQRQGKLVHTVNKRNKGLSDILQYASWQMKGSEAVAKWKGSAGHRKMMQCTTATRAGVAAYKGSNGVWYYVIVYNFSGSNQGGK